MSLRSRDDELELLIAIKRATLAIQQARLEMLLQKAGFRPDQPRVPAGQPDGGQWTDEDGDAALILVSHDDPGEFPKVPDKRPPTTRERNRISVNVSRFLLATELAIEAEQIRAWVWDHARNRIIAYLDEPKFLDELQRAVGTRQEGYDDHHIVEQTPALQDGFPAQRVHGWRNKVHIPTYRHWEITGWYARPNDLYDGLSPREYLRGKSWDERYQVGLKALRDRGVLK